MVDLSLCIVSCNQRDLLAAGLAAIRDTGGDLRIEVIVVDNASTDGSADMVRESFPSVRLVASSENLGYARALNRAFAAARGRYLLALNDDTRVLPAACQSLVEFADRNPDVGVIAPRILNPDGSVQRSNWRGFPSLRSALIEALYLWRIAPWLPFVRYSEASATAAPEPYPVDHVLGAAMMIRAEVVEAVGGMSEEYFLFLEETEWCRRIARAGWRICVVPRAEIVHVGQQSVHTAPERTMPELYRNLVRFQRDHCGRSPAYLAALKAIVGLACLVRIGLWSRRAREQAQRTKAESMRRGYWRVLREISSY